MRRRERGARPGAALLVALATLVLLMAIAIALHAVMLRERRSARRATLSRAATDAADAALASWQARLAAGDPLLDTVAGDPVGARRALAGGAGSGAAGDGGDVADAGGALVTPARVRVMLVTLAGGARLLVARASAEAGAARARRAVSLLLVPDTVRDSGAAPRGRLVPAPERAWAEVP